ncbi:phage recombination protein Bet [Labrys sp. KB_33_2]|uniref:phage recombination protein Bet n=1 Tax=Labrys sp. KB_33_2 TaxID=3237479 RepID=UPI003F91AB4F
MNQIVSVQQSTAIAHVSDAELLTTMESSLYPGARPESIALVLSYCRARNLDPMMKPVHIVPMWVKDAASGKGAMRDVIMPGIYSYRIDAARTGQYVGKSEPEYGPARTETLGGKEVAFPEWCKITVHRLIAGKERPFAAKEFWLENYATAGKDTIAPNAMWTKRSYAQLAKVTEAQALRMAFPEAVSNQPTDDEMEGRVFEQQAIAPPTPPVPPELPAPPPAEGADQAAGQPTDSAIPPEPKEPAEWSFNEYVLGLDELLSESKSEDDLKAAWKGRPQPVRKLLAAETSEMVGLLDKHKSRIEALKQPVDETPPEPPMPEPPAPDLDPPTPEAAPTPPATMGLMEDARAKAREGLKAFNFWVAKLHQDEFEELEPSLKALRSEAAQAKVGA